MMRQKARRGLRDADSGMLTSTGIDFRQPL
jgi:hypothetical protein